MSWLRAHRWPVAAIAAGLGLTIVVMAPHYLGVQAARDADAFRRAAAEDGSGRVAAAALVDVAFAVSYALTAVAFAGSAAGAPVGAAIVAAGAAADVAENLIIVTGVTGAEDLSDGAVTAMRVCGAVKWTGLTVGCLVIIVQRFRSRAGR